MRELGMGGGKAVTQKHSPLPALSCLLQRGMGEEWPIVAQPLDVEWQVKPSEWSISIEKGNGEKVIENGVTKESKNLLFPLCSFFSQEKAWLPVNVSVIWGMRTSLGEQGQHWNWNKWANNVKMQQPTSSHPSSPSNLQAWMATMSPCSFYWLREGHRAN